MSNGNVVYNDTDRFVSREQASALLRQAHRVAFGGGQTELSLESRWVGNVRFARNAIWTSGDMRDNDLWVTRRLNGGGAKIVTNQIDDASLKAAVRRSERFSKLTDDEGDDPIRPPEIPPHPKVWSDATYQLDRNQRASIVSRVVSGATQQKVLAAGYIEVAAQGRTVLDSRGNMVYFPYTTAQYSVTVREPGARGSGWAGVDHHDWAQIDPDKLSEIALDKCLRSRNPVAVEPGRYTAILEPQAVCDLCSVIFGSMAMSRGIAENGSGPFYHPDIPKTSKIGMRVMDERITISADPMDPDAGFVPFDRYGNVFQSALWFERGVLRNLTYNRRYATSQLGKDIGLPNSSAFHMRGETATIPEMIASTKRGILVTRFSNIRIIDHNSLLSTGYTRDGLWLIENGQVSKAIKNFRFTDSPLFALSNVEAIGVAQRVFHPGAPVVVPALKVRDFNFSGLSDAV